MKTFTDNQVQFLRLALVASGLPCDNSAAETILHVNEALRRLGGNFSLREGSEIETFIRAKYKEVGSSKAKEKAYPVPSSYVWQLQVAFIEGWQANDDNWTSVKDDLPKESKEYNCVWEYDENYRGIATYFYNSDDKKFRYGALSEPLSGSLINVTDVTDIITHWRELPPLPKKIK